MNDPRHAFLRRCLFLAGTTLACQFAPDREQTRLQPAATPPTNAPAPSHPADLHRPWADLLPVVGTTPQTVSYEVTVTIPDNVRGPRVSEVWVRYGDGLQWATWEPGPAAASAHKEVVVQARPGNLLRVVVYSGANLERLASGTVAVLQFNHIEGSDAIEVLHERTAFAPSEEAAP